MKKILIVVLILIFILFNFKNVYSKEPESFYKLPEVYKQSLNTNLEGNNYLYPIKIKGLYGFIDVNGKLIVEPKFKSYISICNGYYLAFTQYENYVLDEENYKDPVNGAYLIYPKDKVVKISNYNVYASLSQNKKYAIIYDNSNKQFSSLYDDSSNKEISSIGNDIIFNLTTGQILDQNKGSYQVINVFDSCYIIKDQGKYYMADYSKKKLSTGFDFFVSCVDETFFFKNNNTFFWVDKNGKPFFQYENCKDALPFYNNIAPIIDISGNLKFIDKNKNVLYTYSNCYKIYKKGNVYIANFNNGQIIFDENGKEKLPDNYGGKIQFYYGVDKFITAYNENTSIFDVFDDNGNINYSFKIPSGYSDPSFIEGYVGMLGQGYGLCSIKGENIQWLLEPKYSFIGYFDPFVIVEINNFYNKGLYDLNAKKFILDSKYRDINVYDKNMIYVESAYFNGYINSKGQFIFAQIAFDVANNI